MNTFREFLQHKAAEQNHPERKRRREEWVAALTRLLDRVEAWLRESDPDGVMETTRVPYRVVESSLGAYDVPGLVIAVGDDSVEVRPGGRITRTELAPQGEPPARTQGRVEIADKFQRRYDLYRVILNDADVWYVLDERRRVLPLDRDLLENILRDLLS